MIRIRRGNTIFKGLNGLLIEPQPDIEPNTQVMSVTSSFDTSSLLPGALTPPTCPSGVCGDPSPALPAFTTSTATATATGSTASPALPGTQLTTGGGSNLMLYGGIAAALGVAYLLIR